MHMLMQSNGKLARRCSNFWRVGYSTLLVMALMVMVGTMGVRRAQAQNADAERKAAEIDKQNAQEQDREAEVAKLKAQQDAILAQLQSLEVEKRQLQDELAARKAEGRAGNEAVTEYRRKLAQREQAIAQEREAAAREMLARPGARRPPEFGPDGDAAVEEKANGDRAAMRDWINKKNPAAREPNEGAGRAQLDLVSLADRYVDAVGNLQLAQLELTRMSGKDKENVFTQ